MSVASPCIDVCRLDARGETCVGCRRTLDEIGRWSGMSESERAAVLARLAASEAENAREKTQRDEAEE